MRPPGLATAWLQRCYPPGLWQGPASHRSVLLTLDDGPHPEVTPRLLETLHHAGCPATFFLVGRQVADQPQLTVEVARAGHGVGNHTWDHRPACWSLFWSVDEQVARTEALLTELCPGSPAVFRPPYGVVGGRGAAVLRRLGLTPVYWSLVPGDWNPLPDRVLVDRVVGRLHPGAVLVLHGGHPVQQRTASALGRLIREIRARDFTFVSLAEMLTTAGVEYRLRGEPRGKG